MLCHPCRRVLAPRSVDGGKGVAVGVPAFAALAAAWWRSERPRRFCFSSPGPASYTGAKHDRRDARSTVKSSVVHALVACGFVFMNVHGITESWPHNWYGIWGYPEEPVSAFPTLDCVVAPSWKPPDLERLLYYLSQAPVIVAGGAIIECLLCSEEVPMTSYQSDGIWLWRMDLSHYVRCHSVVLPDRLVQHIRQQKYIAPKEMNVPFHELPWPESFAHYRLRPSPWEL